MLLLAFKSVNNDGPSYLSDLLKFYSPSRQLRSSSDTRLLRIPSFRLKSFGQRKFSYQASSMELSPDLVPSFQLYISLQIGSKDASFPVPVAFSSLRCDRCMCVWDRGGGRERGEGGERECVCMCVRRWIHR